MPAPKATSMRALNRLARQTSQIRQLHMTGTAAQPRLPSQGSTSNQSKPAQDKAESFHPYSPSTTPRYFNTSRVHKAVGDSSTIDFAYLPTSPMPLLDYESATLISRVPILPAYSPSSASRAVEMGTANATLATEPSIITAAGESTHIHSPSALSDVHDGAQPESTDFHDVVSTIASGADAVRDAGRKIVTGVESGMELDKAKGLLKGAWTGLMADVFGTKQPVGKA